MSDAAIPDHYRSLENGPEVEIRIQGSRFLGQGFRIAILADADATVEARARRYHEATHHCTALRLGPTEGPFERSDDDGEPSGTAGLPMLGALRRCELFDALVVVTRYFGGTKLGTGGLVRAYGETARAAVEAAPPRTVWRESVLTLECAYEDLGAIETLLVREATVVRNIERSFAAQPRFVVTVLRSHGDRLRSAAVEATAGRVEVFGPSPA